MSVEQWAEFARDYNATHVTLECLAGKEEEIDGEDIPMTESGFKILLEYSKACERVYDISDFEDYLKSQREINKRIIEGVKPFLTEEQFKKFKAQYGH